MTRKIRLSEAYRGLRNEGGGPVACAFVAVIWVLAGVEVEIDERLARPAASKVAPAEDQLW